MKKIILILLFIVNTLFATNMQMAKQMAEEIATPFFDIHTDHMIEIINSYFHANPELEAVEVYDDMLHQVSISCWKEGSKTHFKINKPLPDTLTASATQCSDRIEKNDKAVGKITLYFKDSLGLTNEEKAYIQEHPVLTVQNEEDFAPINFNVLGTPMGYSIDYINLIAEKIGVKIKFISGYTWFEYLKMMKQKKLDIMVNIAKTEERERYLLFTSPYSGIIDAVFAKTGSENRYTSLKDLNGKKVAVVKGFYEADMLKQYYPDVQIITKNNDTQAIKAVSFGEADVLVDSLQVGNYLIKKLAINNVSPMFEVKEPHFSARLSIATDKDNQVLRDILEKAKSKISEEELISLSDKWFFDDNTNNKNKLLLTKEETAYLKNKKAITMCVDPDWMPYEKIEDGKHIGLAADFMEVIEEKIGKKVVLVPSKTWVESLQLAKDRKCDIMSFLNETEERAKFLNFTPTLYEESEVIIAENKVPYLKGFTSLNGKKVAVMKNYMVDEYIKKRYPNIKTVHTKTQNEALQKVSEGEVFASIGPLIGSAYNISKDKLLNIKVAGMTKLNDNYRIGVRNDDPILLSIMSKAVDSLSEKEKEVIVNSWISIRFEQDVDYSLLWKIIAVAMVLIAIIFLWNRTLLKHIKLKEEAQDELVQLNQTLSQRVEQEVAARMQQQDQLVQQSKMAEIGELLNVIIHQWKQPLTSINLLAQNLPDQFEYGELTKDSIHDTSQKIKKQVDFLVQTIDNFRKFLTPSRKESEFDAVTAINHTLSILTPQFHKYNIEVELNGGKGHMIYGFENEFKQVILNIINNTKDAVLDNKIKTPHIKISVDSVKDMLRIIIQDNGGGIAPELLPDKLFQPYVSTKGEKGTGIGLSMSKTIIEQRMKGFIRAVNIDSGALFEIGIPVT